MQDLESSRVLSVSEAVSGVVTALTEAFDDVTIEGEVSNLRRPASGHAYFTLKDADAQLRCVAWRSTIAGLPFRPEDGQRVQARGGLTVYPPRGDLQLVARSIRLAGEGELRRAFEALRKRLDAEGLFDPRRKRPLPARPRCIGLITSGTGAALHDMLRVIGRRYPLVSVVMASVRVQGEGAAAEIATAIRRLNRMAEADPLRPDLLIVGRGGGSIEDLWAFNEEALARVIHASGIPVVSAVGHETDVTIADLVADVRAATPSQAGELVVPDRRDVIDGLLEFVRQAGLRLHTRIHRTRERLALVVRSSIRRVPQRRLQVMEQRLDAAIERLNRAGRSRVERASETLRAMQERLRALDPERPLRSGYAMVFRQGDVVRNARILQPADSVVVRFGDGDADMEVRRVRPGAPADASET